jgi:dephospho-CoA kinase
MKIAVTGGIATGKSTVSRLLATCLKTCALDADLICRDLMNKGQPGWHGIFQAWGERFMDAEGRIDRRLLRKTIFAEKTMRLELERILHPLVRAEIARSAREKKRTGDDLLVEVPLLYEVGWQGDFDWIVTVFATESKCVQRIISRDNVTEHDARNILTAQMPVVCKALLADSVIDNSGLWAYTCFQVYHLAGSILK